jgi:hypothetical protein
MVWKFGQYEFSIRESWKSKMHLLIHVDIVYFRVIYYMLHAVHYGFQIRSWGDTCGGVRESSQKFNRKLADSSTGVAATYVIEAHSQPQIDHIFVIMSLDNGNTREVFAPRIKK